MYRAKFITGDQNKFLESVKEKSKLSWEKLADVMEISKRTLFDWRREKHTMEKTAFLKLSNLYSIHPSQNVKFISMLEIIARKARNGGIARLKKYGPPGTIESRRIGGKRSQLLRHLYPKKYKKFIKQIKKPRKSKNLAELTGILFGDGGVTNYQVSITLTKNHKSYIEYIKKLIYKLLNIKAKSYFYNDRSRKNICILKISSIETVKFFEKFGLKPGNKIKHQSPIPKWISENKNYAKYCLKGLMDTDGCIYKHEHNLNNQKFFNIGICFSNHSKPLLKFAFDTLQTLGFNPKCNGHGVYLYRKKEVSEYYKKIGTSNTYNTDRLKIFMERCERG